MACCIALSSSNPLAGSASRSSSGLPCRNVSSTSLTLLGKHSRRNRLKEKSNHSVSENKNEAVLSIRSCHVPPLLQKKGRVDATVGVSRGVSKKLESTTTYTVGARDEKMSSENHISNEETPVKLLKQKLRPIKKNKRPIIDESEEDTGDDDESNNHGKEHKCTVCRRSFLRPWRLKAHMERHSKRPSFKCDHEGCDKAYSYQQHLDRHKSISHADCVVTVSKIMCPAPNCGFVLASSLSLKKHFQRFHDESNFKYPCSVCDKKFKKHRQLTVHLMEHTNTPPFRCEICNAGSMTEAALKQHRKIHKVHHCSVPGCEMTFENFSTLRKHKAEHNSCFSTMKCAHCDKVYKTRKGLEEHVLTHLNEQSKVFYCPSEGCTRVYYQKRNLNHHIRFHHEKKSKYMCTWEGCGKPCHTQKRLEVHLNVHKNGIAPPKPNSKPRAKRKDAGLVKRAAAVLLTGIAVPRDVEKKLLSKDETEYCNHDTNDPSGEEEACFALYREPNEADTLSITEKESNVVISCGEEPEQQSSECYKGFESDISAPINGTDKSHVQEIQNLIENLDEIQPPKTCDGVRIYVADSEGCVNDINPDVDVSDLQFLNHIEILSSSLIDKPPSLMSNLKFIENKSMCVSDVSVVDNVEASCSETPAEIHDHVVNSSTSDLENVVLELEPILNLNLETSEEALIRIPKNCSKVNSRLDVNENLDICLKGMSVNLESLTSAETEAVQGTGASQHPKDISQSCWQEDTEAPLRSKEEESNNIVSTISSDTSMIFVGPGETDLSCGHPLTLCSETIIDDPGCGADLQALLIIPHSKNNNFPPEYSFGPNCEVCHLKTDADVSNTTSWSQLTNELNSLVNSCELQASGHVSCDTESEILSGGLKINLKSSNDKPKDNNANNKEDFAQHQNIANSNNIVDGQCISKRKKTGAVSSVPLSKKIVSCQDLSLKGDGTQKHLETDKEELQGPIKDDDEDDGNVSGDNSDESRVDDSGSDDDDFLPGEDEDDDFSGEEGEGDDQDEEDDEEDDEQDEQPDDDDDDDDEDEDDEDGGANLGEQHQNDDNNNSDNVNCDSANDSGRQMDSNPNDGAFHIGDGSETGLDRSVGHFEDDLSVKDEYVDVENDNAEPSTSKQSKTLSTVNQKSKKSEESLCTRRRFSLRLKVMEDCNKEKGKQGKKKEKELNIKAKPHNKNSDKKQISKYPAERKVKKRSADSSSSSDVPLAKKSKNSRNSVSKSRESDIEHKKKAAPNTLIQSHCEYEPFLRGAKVCSRFSEDDWINILKKASEVFNFTEISKD